jgi:hypothetical protein
LKAVKAEGQDPDWVQNQKAAAVAMNFFLRSRPGFGPSSKLQFPQGAIETPLSLSTSCAGLQMPGEIIDAAPRLLGFDVAEMNADPAVKPARRRPDDGETSFGWVVEGVAELLSCLIGLLVELLI